MKVGIIGGTGKMGQWLSRFLEENGYETVISGRNTEMTNIQLVREVDIVVISVPISVTEDVIREISDEIREDQLLTDLTSVKMGPVAAMLESKGEVVGMHPLFNEMITTVKGQTILACPDREGPIGKKFLRTFEDAGANIVRLTPKEHDRHMAIVQGLLHFNLLSLGDAIQKLGIDVQEDLKYTSPIYRMRFDMVGRILAQEARLYAEIELSNPFTHEVIAAFQNAVDELKDIVGRNDKEAFIRYFERASGHYGETAKEQAIKDTNRMIEKMTREER